MEDDPTASPAPPSPPNGGERAEAEDVSPKDAPADPTGDRETVADIETGADETEPDTETGGDETTSASPAPQPTVTDELPRTTTTGDDEQDLRSVGDGAASGPPGDDLDDSRQRHD